MYPKYWVISERHFNRKFYRDVETSYGVVRIDDRLCLLVMIDFDETGRKELLALLDGYLESEASWMEVLIDLKQRGLKDVRKLAAGGGALGFWKAVAKCWPDTDQQCCWVHKTANELEKLPKTIECLVKDHKNIQLFGLLLGFFSNV